MPALGKTKELSKRLVSGTNLKGIGTACQIYAFDHDDNFPPNLEVLITECDLSPKSLESPIKPNRFTGPVYIYIAGQSGAANPQNVLAYENPAYQSEGTNVLFVDGHSEYIRGTGVIEHINATYKRLGKDAPKIEFNTFK
jgi:prepilin-type processing-associated H-X9-DG protein